MKDDTISLKDTIEYCLSTPDFIKEYKRLTGAKLGSGSSIEIMIDKATGFNKKEIQDLFDFIKNYVWIPYALLTKLEEK